VSTPTRGGGGSAGRASAPGTPAAATPSAKARSGRASANFQATAKPPRAQPGSGSGSGSSGSGSSQPAGGAGAKSGTLSGADHSPPSADSSRFASAYPVARTRRARLQVAHVDPWSVMKLSFLLSVALGIMSFVAVAVLWTVLDMLGVFDAVGSTVTDVTGSASEAGFDVKAFFSLSRVLSFTTVVALVDAVLITALATIGAWLYNLSAAFVGGVEVTLAEEE